MSFPPGTEMFHFPGFASRTYEFSAGYGVSRGLPHSEIPGSKSARNSPGLIAACYVLHRLLVPRHPSNALFILFSSTAVRSDQSDQRFLRETRLPSEDGPIMFYCVPTMSFAKMCYPLRPST